MAARAKKQDVETEAVSEEKKAPEKPVKVDETVKLKSEVITLRKKLRSVRNTASAIQIKELEDGIEERMGILAELGIKDVSDDDADYIPEGWERMSFEDAMKAQEDGLLAGHDTRRNLVLLKK